MAMNKAEKAEMARAHETAEKALVVVRHAMAMRFTPGPEPATLPVPGSAAPFDAYVNGWQFNIHTGKAFKAWTGAVVHGDGWREPGIPRQTASQNAQAVYSSKEHALIALRMAKEREFAKVLADLDEQIERENPHG